MKSTKQRATAFLLPKNKIVKKKQSSKKSAATKKELAKKVTHVKVDKATKTKKTQAQTHQVAKTKPVRLEDLLKSKNNKNYASFLSTEPKTKIKHILISQPQPEGGRSPFFDLAEKYKLKLQFTPFVTVEGLPARDFRKQRIHIQDYNGIILTSRNAIDHFFRICEEMRVKLSQETKFFCTSEAIALYLQKYTQYRKRKVFFGDPSNNKELRGHLLKHKDTTKCLYICPEVRSKDEITSFMDDQKIQYVEAVMYRTVPADLKAIDWEKFDMLVVYSPAAINALFHNLPKFKQGKLKIGVYGKTTADALIEAKLKFHLMAPLDGIPSINHALEQYLRQAK